MTFSPRQIFHATAALLGIGIAAAMPARAATVFECSSNQEISIRLVIDEMNPDRAVLLYDGGEMINSSIMRSGKRLSYDMVRVPMDRDTVYSGYGKTITIQPGIARLDDEGERSRCVEQAQVNTRPHQPMRNSAIGNQETVLNWQGRSLGGKLRSGPGTSFPQVGSTAEGTFLTILKNSGVIFDGYAWFQVALNNGQRAYQWGGIMCSNGQQIEGIYDICRRY